MARNDKITADETSAQTDSGAHEGSELRHSPLEAVHLRAGAKMVRFGGWWMPLSYPSGTLAEHRSCRARAAVFDVSHLGTVRIEGPGSFDLLQQQLGNDLGKIEPGRAQYTHLLDEDDGSVLDDIIVWWRDEEVFDVMPNASNTARVVQALGGIDTTAQRAVVAVQGPDARSLLSSVSPGAGEVPRFRVRRVEWRGTEIAVAGTGYTGEDGVECSVPADKAVEFFEAVLGCGVAPAGLGARDTLRLEAGLPLHGHELGPGITPIQAGLAWAIGWDKGPFRGRAALEQEREDGPARRLRGIVADGRQPPREPAPVQRDGEKIGAVTSGNFSPVLGCGIAMAFIDTSSGADVGDPVAIEMRGRALEGALTALPFVRDGKATTEPAVAGDKHR
ncbi:MAG TPA: glycine cleavage system aminomethyltransferase GcvT [Acidimicrobiales bacterium]|nr:glycine cleavage system aminomethyltransferase GcvT [Acidimicrobiales bacterium]